MDPVEAVERAFDRSWHEAILARSNRVRRWEAANGPVGWGEVAAPFEWRRYNYDRLRQFKLETSPSGGRGGYDQRVCEEEMAAIYAADNQRFAHDFNEALKRIFWRLGYRLKLRGLA